MPGSRFTQAVILRYHLIMINVTLYHNPRCSKSRAALALLTERGISPTIISYIDNPLSESELLGLLNQLGLTATDLIRKKDPLFRAQSLDNQASEAACLQAMLKEPRLIERPIVITPQGACVARPPERLLEILPDA